jgi:hypothetical protein
VKRAQAVSRLIFSAMMNRSIRARVGPVVIGNFVGIVKTLVVCSDAAMSQPFARPSLYKGYRYPPEIISHGVWLYYRFAVSLRDVSELPLARGIKVSHEAVRIWTLRFGLEYARRLRRRGDRARTSGISMNCA